MREFSISIFNLLFPVVMILLPLFIALPVQIKPHPSYTDSEQRQRTKKLTVGLCLGSSAAVLVHLGIYSTIPFGLNAISWILFFPLWFLLGVPLLQAKDPGWVPTVKIQGDVRKASLESRAARPHAIWPLWIGAALVWVGIAAIAIAFIPGSQKLIKFPYVMFMGVSLFFLLIGYWMSRRVGQEPEPFAEHGTESLAKEYFHFRQAKIRCTFVLLGSSSILTEVLALTLLLNSNWILFAWVGALGGSVIGTLGGVAGVWSSFRRAKLNRIVIENQTK